MWKILDQYLLGRILPVYSNAFSHYKCFMQRSDLMTHLQTKFVVYQGLNVVSMDAYNTNETPAICVRLSRKPNYFLFILCYSSQIFSRLLPRSNPFHMHPNKICACSTLSVCNSISHETSICLANNIQFYWPSSTNTKIQNPKNKMRK